VDPTYRRLDLQLLFGGCSNYSIAYFSHHMDNLHFSVKSSIAPSSITTPESFGNIIQPQMAKLKRRCAARKNAKKALRQ
jgi:hypothetical protein